MGGKASLEDWEYSVASDLVPYLMADRPAGQVQRLPGPGWLPPGAEARVAGSIGRHGIDDLLVFTASARPAGRLGRRRVCTPLSVLGIGERAAALWVQAFPFPASRPWCRWPTSRRSRCRPMGPSAG